MAVEKLFAVIEIILLNRSAHTDLQHQAPLGGMCDVSMVFHSKRPLQSEVTAFYQSKQVAQPYSILAIHFAFSPTLDTETKRGDWAMGPCFEVKCAR